jgi:hypothetical protein
MTDVDAQAAQQIEEMGPIDYAVIEWPREQPTGAAVPLLMDLVERGIVRIIDIAFIGKDENGSVYAIDISDFDGDGTYSVFEGASSGVISSQDLEDAGGALEPATSAAIIIWENRWLAPLAVALRKSGAQLVADGRIPVQAILAALDELDAAEPTT